MADEATEGSSTDLNDCDDTNNTFSLNQSDFDSENEDECFSDVFSSESGSDEEFYGFENEEESDEYTSEHDDDPNDVSCDVDIAVSTN